MMNDTMRATRDPHRSTSSTEPAAPDARGVTAETQYNLRLLHHEKVLEPTKAAELIVSEIAVAADPRVVESLIQIWVLNCFEYSDDPQAYSTYFFSSFMSHSCFPNAVWHYSGADHVLRCRREIKVWQHGGGGHFPDFLMQVDLGGVDSWCRRPWRNRLCQRASKHTQDAERYVAIQAIGYLLSCLPIQLASQSVRQLAS